MNGESRREMLLNLLSEKGDVRSGEKLARQLGVSRQVVVQDIALLRASGHNILSTNHGYLLMQPMSHQRVFKVRHAAEQAIEEMNIIVDLGGRMEDEFVYHRTYGVVRAQMNIRSRRDALEFVNKINEGSSSQLLHITSGYHYHTVTADSDKTLDLIQEELQKAGFLAPLRDYEPVNFWGNAE